MGRPVGDEGVVDQKKKEYLFQTMLTFTADSSGVEPWENMYVYILCCPPLRVLVGRMFVVESFASRAHGRLSLFERGHHLRHLFRQHLSPDRAQRSRNGATSREGFAVNSQMTNASIERAHSPSPPH